MSYKEELYAKYKAGQNRMYNAGAAFVPKPKKTIAPKVKTYISLRQAILTCKDVRLRA
jgi:hypothetical protein